MTNSITNIAGYQFKAVANVDSMHEQVQSLCAQTHLKGNVFISPEGINLGLAGSASDMDHALDRLGTVCGFDRLLLSTTHSDMIPFRRLLVRIREELVPGPAPAATANGQDPVRSSYITSDELRHWLSTGYEVTLLDLRNSFEYELGTFNHAQHLGLRHFRELKSATSRLAGLSKEKPVVTFCTGGIRCEKGAPYIAGLGFREVHQLKGGVLDYLRKFKDEHWHGDCFVFDERVSLDPMLKPTFTRLCRSCQAVLSADETQWCASCIPPAALDQT